MDGFGLITGILAYFAYCKCLEPVFVFCKIICLMLFKEMTSNEVNECRLQVYKPTKHFPRRKLAFSVQVNRRG